MANRSAILADMHHGSGIAYVPGVFHNPMYVISIGKPELLGDVSGIMTKTPKG